MGKITGFMDYTRKTSTDVPPLERIENFNEFHVWLSREEQQTQAARCMDCGVPFCQAGMLIGGIGLSAEQPDPRVERPGLSGQVGAGAPPPARHQPLSGVHQPGLSRPVRGRLHLR